MMIRPLAAGDRDAVHEMLARCGAFSEEEVAVALELVDAGVMEGVDGGYMLFGAEEEECLRGYVCIGRTPMTRSTWHLYWICVHPGAQRRGIGQALQAYAEAFIRERGGERIVLETSSRADYDRSRRFYERNGYLAAGRIRDYYRPGDDCVYYCKTL